MLTSLFAQHQSSPQGLSNEEAKKRFEIDGPNELKAKKRKSYILQFLEEFKDLMVIILMIATVLAFATGEITDALIILFIIFLNATIGFFQKFKAEKAIEALKKLVAPYAKVLRNGEVKKIPAREIVPGDILILEEGEQIPADAILFESNEIQTQEAALTGESTAIEKTAYSDNDVEATFDQENENSQSPTAENSLFMGTNIVHGSGKAIVIKTGMETEMGKIATLTSETVKDKSPLQKELQHIGVFIGKLTFVISAILFLFGIFVQKRAIIDTLLFAVSVAVAAVPEGLPTTITIALALGVQRLVKNNAIVKQLSSAETLGATTVICTDKTGTLTKNEMTVKELYFDRFNAFVEGVGYAPEGKIKIESGKNIAEGSSHSTEKSLTLELLLTTAGLCNNANIQQESDNWKVVGDPTEGALITLVKKSHLDLDQLKNDYKKLHEYPFDSARKCMTVVYQHVETGKLFAFMKGAPSSIFERCDHIMMNQHAIRMDKETKHQLVERSDNMAKNGLRVLGFAFKELSAHEQKLWEKEKKHYLHKEEIEKNLNFLGLTGMIDPPRAEVKEAINLTKLAGIKVYIITGDHGLTAQAVAKEIGLVPAENKNSTGERQLIITGDEMKNMSESELRNLLNNKKLSIIFARVNPEHKLRVVSALKGLGEVVAVTGDGVNDAPALKRSDIGIAMGTGTDVSKEAANMILADDSFSTIVKAVEEGRTIYENLKKFIFFMFSTNIGELVAIFTAIILNLPAPLTPVLILCINLFTDILPALALALEPAEPNIMLKKPRKNDQKMLNRNFIFRVFYVGLFIGGVTISTFIWELSRNGWEWGQLIDARNPSAIKATSMAFVILVMIQMVHAFNAKSEELSVFKSGFFKNSKLIGATLISVLMVIAIVEIPFLQKYLHTTGLDLKEWLMISLGSFSILIVEEIRKWRIRSKISYPQQL